MDSVFFYLGLVKYGLSFLLIIWWTDSPAQGNSEALPGQVAPELVGRWCLVDPANPSANTITNSCITLNADGSYEIHLDRTGSVNASAFHSNIQESDYGTWRVSADRIHYNSSSQGNGSFRLQKINHPRLENTATIVLDGMVFCADFAHDPW